MKRDVMGQCPVCGGETEVTRITCYTCDTIVEGHFQPCKFCKLSVDQKAFVDIFIKCRGNIKEVEKELGISYPTVKNRLEDVAAALGYKGEPEPVTPSKRQEILEKLNKGEITVDEALDYLK